MHDLIVKETGLRTLGCFILSKQLHHYHPICFIIWVIGLGDTHRRIWYRRPVQFDIVLFTSKRYNFRYDIQNFVLDTIQFQSDDIKIVDTLKLDINSISKRYIKFRFQINSISKRYLRYQKYCPSLVQTIVRQYFMYIF